MSRIQPPRANSVSLLDRRGMLKLALAAYAALGIGSSSHAKGAAQAAGDQMDLGPAEPFSYERLKAFAKGMAAKPYRAPDRPNPEIVSQIDYDAHNSLKFRLDRALHADRVSAHPISFMHVGQFFPKSVRMHEVTNGQAREILYDRSYFDMPADSIARGLGNQPSAFAGFSIREANDEVTEKGDWKARESIATWLGASYFRAIADTGQVGLSARGVAMFPEPGAPEEFPDFVSFWFEPSTRGKPITVYALLDGPSIAGAFRFLITRTSATIMDIEAELTLRKDVTRLGLAALTSMFWFSETAKAQMVDWRPEVHDSDGLAIWTGAGERIWRPLNNPRRVMTSSFLDDGPRGFGLMQRDRVFDHYQDGVRYHERPSTWIEPAGDWGKGAVQLVEIPTDDEIHDNIVAYWLPAKPTKAGDTVALGYRLTWQDGEPIPMNLARCVATRIGRGGQPGRARPAGVRKFMVEFLGESLANVPFGVKPEVVLSASRGAFSYVFAEEIPHDVRGHWRAQFDLTADGDDPIEMRCFLKVGGQTVTETWLYQYHPPEAPPTART